LGENGGGKYSISSQFFERDKLINLFLKQDTKGMKQKGPLPLLFKEEIPPKAERWLS
jgi:hypothetical protein